MHCTRRAAAERRRPDRGKFAARGSRRRGNLLRAGFAVSRRHANEHSEQPIERNTCADVAFKSPDRRTIPRPQRLADRTSPAPRSGLTGYGRKKTRATVSRPLITSGRRLLTWLLAGTRKVSRSRRTTCQRFPPSPALPFRHIRPGSYRAAVEDTGTRSLPNLPRRSLTRCHGRFRSIARPYGYIDPYL